MAATENERYPVGRFKRRTAPIDETERLELIATIADAPATLRRLVEPLTQRQLETPYRDGGWTIRQVVHHVPDSHMNAYVRMKLAYTEDTPAIKTYEEALWAELADVKEAPVGISLNLLEALHYRWVLFLRSLEAADFLKSFRHPDWDTMPLYDALALYAWHSRHHIAHVEQALKRQKAD